MKLNNVSRIIDFYLSTMKRTPVVPKEGLFETKFHHLYKNIITLQLCYDMNENSIATYLGESSDSQNEDKNVDTKLFYFYINYKDFSSYKEVINDLEYTRYIKQWFYSYMSIVEPLPIDYSSITLPMIFYPNAYDTENSVLIKQEFTVMKINIMATIHDWKNRRRWPCKENMRWIKKNVTNCVTQCLKQFFGKYCSSF